MKSKSVQWADRTAIISFVANFCAIFALICIVGLLSLASVLGGRSGQLAAVSAPLAANCSSQNQKNGESCPLASMPAVLFPVSAGDPSEAKIKLTIGDDGFSPNRIDLALSSSRFVEISNNGVKPHSFVIDDLGIDTGPINPGQTKIANLGNIDPEVAGYVYYSNAGQDDKQSFNGTIAVR